MFFRFFVLTGWLALTCPALAQERQWTFNTGEEEAYLVFGVPDSEDAGISFWCEMKSGQIRIFVPETSEELKPGETVKLEIKSDGQAYVYDAQVEANEEAGIPSVQAVTLASDLLFDVLGRNDRFSLKAGQHETIFPLMQADFPALVRVCAKS